MIAVKAESVRRPTAGKAKGGRHDLSGKLGRPQGGNGRPGLRVTLFAGMFPGLLSSASTTGQPINIPRVCGISWSTTPIRRSPSFVMEVAMIWRWYRGTKPTMRERQFEAAVAKRLAADMDARRTPARARWG